MSQISNCTTTSGTLARNHLDDYFSLSLFSDCDRAPSEWSGLNVSLEFAFEPSVLLRTRRGLRVQAVYIRAMSPDGPKNICFPNRSFTILEHSEVLHPNGSSS